MKEKTEFEKFSDATKRIMSVSKDEFLKREAEWREQREQQRKIKKRRASRVSSGHGANES